MKTKLIVLLVSGAILSAVVYDYTIQSNSTPEKKVIRKLKHVEPITRNPLKNRTTLACPANRKDNLRLLYNDERLWQKSHEEFFSLQSVITSNDRRLKASERIYPLPALYSDKKAVRYIDFISCSGNTKTLSVEEINNSDEPYFLGLNRKGWIKLMRKDEKARYKTVAKALIEINLRDEEK